MSNLLTRVTITGADDSTSPEIMRDLSAEFPFVEWGILVSKRQEGNPRFPSRKWIDQLASIASGAGMKLSTHICGKWVRDILMGAINWSELPACFTVSARAQINTHAESHSFSSGGMVASLHLADVGQMRQRCYIFQQDGVNDNLAMDAWRGGINTSLLFDTSHGAGRLPDAWTSPPPGLSCDCGYAGGLGPDNVVEQVARIAKVANGTPFWIDMERRVRVEDDSALDLAAVISVLAQTEPLIRTWGKASSL